jgi:hypothetical protein
MLKPQTVVFVFVPSEPSPSISERLSPPSQPPSPPSLSPTKLKSSYVAEKLLLLAFAILVAFGVGVSINAQPRTPSPANPPTYPAASSQMPPLQPTH